METKPDTLSLARDRFAEISANLLGEPTQKTRTEYRWGRQGSFAAIVAGPKRGVWRNHETGEGGGIVALVQSVRSCNTRDAMQWLADFTGQDRPPSPHRIRPDIEVAQDDRQRIERALKIWREAGPAENSLAEIYLKGRGLVLPSDCIDIRFHGQCPRNAERLPAMVSLFRDIRTNEPVGIHRTYLRRDGSGKAEGQAKMMLGRSAGAAIKISPDDAVVNGLGIAEGIENALAVIGTGWSPVWALGSAGAIGRFPVLNGIEALTVFADADQAGMKPAKEAAQRWADNGRTAAITAPKNPGKDFNDAIGATA